MLLALLFLSHQWFWILLGLALYKLLPMLAKIINRSPSTQKQSNSNHGVFDEQYNASQDRKLADLHYQYLSSYYSYDEQPQAHYPQALPPQPYSARPEKACQH